LKAAEQGHALAQYDLAAIYDNGYGIKKDMQNAAVWYRKAAEQGDAQAQCNLAIIYKTGDGAEKDMQQAAMWFTKAAEQGYAQAQSNLGVKCANGDGADEARDVEEPPFNTTRAEVGWLRGPSHYI
jgi:TPR repeat protein